MFKVLASFVLGIAFALLTVLAAFTGIVFGWEYNDNSDKDKATKNPVRPTPSQP